MKITNKIIILLLLILFVTACKKTPEGTLQYNFKQGHGNLVISTFENAPPDIIYPNSDFMITVKLENQGAYDLTNGRIKILGFDDKYIYLFENEADIISLEEEPLLLGKSSLNPLGETTFIEFEAHTKDLFPGAESHPAPYFIKADYDYQTELSQTICLNPKIYDAYDSGCKVEPKISLNGQGSPLAITELEEIIYPGPVPQVEFRLHLKNQGRGKVKEVRLNQAKLSDKPLNCEFKNNPNINKKVFNFKEEQEATLICKMTLEEQKSYSTILYVDLHFTYSIKEKKTLTLKK